MLPRKIQNLIDKKQEFIDSQRSKLERSVVDMQEKLLNIIISDAISELDTKDGKILNTTRNYRILAELDNVYNEFNVIAQIEVVTKMGQGLINLNELNAKYFSVVKLDDITSKRFDLVVAKTDKLMASRIGITPEGEIKTGGFLDSFISDNRLLTNTKQIVARGITGGMNITDLRNDLKQVIVGTEDTAGGFEKYYKQFAYDTFQEYDRAYAKTMADEFGMDYAVYSGGLIKDSRDFCREHNNKVYSRDEIAEFGNWIDPKTGDVPSYISEFPGYDPFTHLGGFNCRHSLNWIPKASAIQMRKDLASE
jgi:hypothetical protein